VPLYVSKTFDKSGRLTGRVEFRCGADDEAMAAMLYLNKETSSELWCGARHVTTWHGRMTGMEAERDASGLEPKRGRGRPRTRPLAAA
jgi:hypothetical protein